MLSSDLQAMTVVQLRKLAKENNIKLAAGVDKATIIQKVAKELGVSHAPAGGQNEALQAAPLAADVTSVEPRGDLAETYRSAYQQVRQARTNLMNRPGLKNTLNREPQGVNPSRFGPRANYSTPAPSTDNAYGMRQPEQPPLPQKTIDGYKLGYRAAQPREYGRQEYRSPNRMEYHRPMYPSGSNTHTPQPNRNPEVYYNDAVYKPVRDSKIIESLENGEIPDALQAQEGEPGEGILEILPDGFGFLRSRSLLPGRKDFYVSVATIRRYDLRTGDFVAGKVRPGRDLDKFAALMYVDTINGKPYDAEAERPLFDELTAIYPNRRIKLESCGTESNWPMRITDLIAPIGFGQRSMIVAPPESGKTIMMQEICKAIKQNDEDAVLMMLLIDERPEAVTEVRDALDGIAEVFATTFDEAPDAQTRVADTMLERAQRLVEQGKNVIVLLDSLTKLTRAYQAAATQGSRTMTNTVTPTALVKPKRFFGAARNTREGGSLTVIATILTNTGSRVDDIIFEEFKGTANMTLWLDTPEANEPMFPVIDMRRSGTKREDMLLEPEAIESLKAVRMVLGSATNREALVQLIDMMSKTTCNADLFVRLKDWVALWEKSGFLAKK
ncbi:MAG TPA: transcription termination factor Rho [Candidatus Limiplasma sp.]|nr:transcription termination factor Rho [Candidatus Limiplasma sp.]HRX09501.1 transcription termination factor Rho [Candidatus Limiplasma sp.]